MVEAINLHAIVLDVVDAMGPLLENRRVTVRGDLTRAFVDRGSTTRILTSLLTQASSYTSRDARIDIKIGPGAAVHLAVTAK